MESAEVGGSDKARGKGHPWYSHTDLGRATGGNAERPLAEQRRILAPLMRRLVAVSDGRATSFIDLYGSLARAILNLELSQTRPPPAVQPSRQANKLSHRSSSLPIMVAEHKGV